MAEDIRCVRPKGKHRRESKALSIPGRLSVQTSPAGKSHLNERTEKALMNFFKAGFCFAEWKAQSAVNSEMEVAYYGKRKKSRRGS